VHDFARMLQRVLGDGITLELQVERDAGNVRASASELEQILLNLIVNARDAMPKGGTIMVASHRVERPSDGPAPHGPCIALGVTDTGEGISADVLSHVFEPFFTTKPPSIGTGLGLSTVESIVRSCHGEIAVESKPGTGTTFRVFLPIVSAPSDRAASPDLDLTRLPQGSEAILVVDDDESIRRVLQGMLQTLGYRVFVAEGASTALQILGRERIDLMLVDSVMPGVSGEALEAEATRHWPTTRVVLMSGYIDRPRPRDARGRSLPFVEKPLELACLALTLRKVLEPRVEPT
jgi:two-component system, cell cycle sensor histidine kinase and response regulator CckA